MIAEQEKARADEATGKLREADAIVSADKEKVELQLKERVWGKPTSPAAFQLNPPQGVKVVEVE